MLKSVEDSEMEQNCARALAHMTFEDILEMSNTDAVEALAFLVLHGYVVIPDVYKVRRTFQT